MNEGPVASGVPPVAFAYQLNVPSLAVAPSVIVPVPQRLPGVVDTTCGLYTLAVSDMEFRQAAPALFLMTAL